MSAGKAKHRKSNAEVNLGFQIAPMIDVIFVILLYFMVMAGQVQKENAHNTKLPGTEASTTEPVVTPDEVSVLIEEDGQVYMNDEPMDTPDSKELPQLASSLSQLEQSSRQMDSKLLVTIYANEVSKYQRVVDVFDALSRAQVSNVTFQASMPDY